jgi:protein-S-isoprenylcysteine O-methyltransferase Ste14
LTRLGLEWAGFRKALVRFYCEKLFDLVRKRWGKCMSIDDFPIWFVFVATVLLVVAAIEVGYMLGKSAHRRTEEEKESPVSAIAGTVLALLAFILAFTFAIVSDRYDNRKALVREEAGAIRSSYSQASFLSEPDRGTARGLYQQYVDILLEAAQVTENGGTDEIPELIGQAQAIQAQLWSMAVAKVNGGDNSDISAMYADSLTEMANVQAERIAVALQARIPTGIWIVLYALVILGMIAVGYQTAIAASRRSWAMVLLALSFSIIITLIAALDNPEHGYLPVSQQPLKDLQVWMQQY